MQMKIIISPAKKMNMTDTMEWKDLPVYLEQAKRLRDYIRGLNYEEAKALWKCNDKIAKLNYERFADMDLERNLTPAVFSYEGIQYQYMAAEVMDADALSYLQDHLRILSGFYGILKPFDGIVPYRLEMQAKISTDSCRDLYTYWGDLLYRELTEDGADVILNLASKEYSRCIEKYLTSGERMITVVFGELVKGKAVQKGTMAKMARGEMVRYMAEHLVTDVKQIRNFDRLGYRFEESLSSETEYVFLK